MLTHLFSAFASRPGEPAARDARVDALYAEATAAWRQNDAAGAQQRLQEAILLDNNLPVLHSLLGTVLLERQQFDPASAAFERALALNPRFPLVLHTEVHAALAKARADLERGVLPDTEARHTGPTQRISVIICSNMPHKFARVCANYHRLLAGVPHEIIGIHDAHSMCEGYNRAMRQARGELLVFSHDDIEILAPDFADRLRNRLQRFEVLGVVGSTSLAGSSWIYSRWPHIHGQVGMPAEEGITVTAFHMRGAATAGAQVLDGLFIACRRELAESIGFDEACFDGWHMYDFDFSYRAWRAGRRTAVCHDFLIAHASPGGFGPDWQRYAQRFTEKHPDTRASFGEFDAPQLASVSLRSVGEWRLFTEHMTARSTDQSGAGPAAPA